MFADFWLRLNSINPWVAGWREDNLNKNSCLPATRGEKWLSATKNIWSKVPPCPSTYASHSPHPGPFSFLSKLLHSGHHSAYQMHYLVPTSGPLHLLFPLPGILFLRYPDTGIFLVTQSFAQKIPLPEKTSWQIDLSADLPYLFHFHIFTL